MYTYQELAEDQSLGKGVIRHFNAMLLSDLQTISISFTCLKNVFKLIFDFDHTIEIHVVNLPGSESNVQTYLETVAHKVHQHCQGPDVNKLAWQEGARLSD